MDHTWNNVSKFGKWVTLRIMGHTLKKGQDLKKQVTLGKLAYTVKKWVILGKIGHTVREKWMALGKMCHTQKNWLHLKNYTQKNESHVEKCKMGHTWKK